MIYDHKKIEAKWRKVWDDNKVYKPDLGKSKRPFYNLMMFPYPSAEGLHVGNMYAFTGADVYGRFKRMQGFDVFEPIGLDGFGIHSENYAIKVGKHPAEQAKISEKHFYDQLNKIGNGFAWDQRLETYDPEYYKWTQWLFAQMFKQGLAYRGKALVNWCPSCKTVLADEQVEAGVCERCKTEVVKREMEQWWFKITAYADRLLGNLDKIDWPKKIKTAQRNWIGRSQGHTVSWQMANSKGHIDTFTTRIDTLLGVTFLAVGAGKGGYNVIHPVTGEELPVLAADYVVADYGTGVVMGVPASDERDRAFAKKHGLEIRKFKPFKPQNEAFVRPEVRYHLRDWLISRQRYWGPPIPMIRCEECQWQAVPEEDLPVLLPKVKEWRPIGKGKSPLETAPRDWLEVACPKCGKTARRETDVSDTFLDSAWYYLRYPSTRSARSGQVPFDPKITRTWLPVDAYIGGAEHAVLHLLYSRFVWMFLRDYGYLEVDRDGPCQGEEPFPFLFSHGLIVKGGAKMSKSRGNVVNPDEYIDRYGADALRMYLMFVGPYGQGGDFRDTGMVGMYRFLERVWRLFQAPLKVTPLKVKRKLHRTIKKVTEDLGKFKYNTAIAALMELTNQWKDKSMSKENAVRVVKLLAPLAPFMAEELWRKLGQKGSVHLASWPEYDPELVKEEAATVVVQVNGKVRASFATKQQIANSKEQIVKLAQEKIGRWIEGKKISRVVWVPQKLVNFVVE